MVLSTIPIESGHVILHHTHHLNQVQQQQQQQQQGVPTNGLYERSSAATANGQQQLAGTSGASTATTSSTNQQSSKLLVLQNHLGENYLATATTTAGGKTNVSDIHGNGIGNIVLLATEQVEIHEANGTTGVVVNGEGLAQGDEELTSLSWLQNKNLLEGIKLSTKAAKPCASPVRSQANSGVGSSGHVSPTSDFLEDSCVSEDNGSSANSSSDQGISVYSAETSPASYHFINTNNNNVTTVNKNQVITSLPTTQTVTTTVLSPGGTPVYVLQQSAGGQLQSVVSKSHRTTSTTPHQHFHKKYLRENAPYVTPKQQQQQQQHQQQQLTQQTVQIQPQRQQSPQEQLSPQTTPPVFENVVIKTEYPSTPIKTEYTYAQPSPRPNTTHITIAPTNGGLSSASSTSSSSSFSSASSTSSATGSPPKQKHPNNLPYDPKIHTTNKPPYSFSSLIFMAIEDAPERALPVKEIYAWIVHHFPYFVTAPTGWKNSVRHNLSLNKCFQKVEKAPNMGKGSLWRVEQQYRQNLVQALARSPFYPYSNVEKCQMKTTSRPAESPPVSQNSSNRPLNAELFPRLSKVIAEMAAVKTTNGASPPLTPADDDGYQHSPASFNSTPNFELISGGNFTAAERLARDWGADSIDDVNAATAMLALKHGPKVFNESFHNGVPPIITSSPSEDHTYSAGGISRSNSNPNAANQIDNHSNGTSSDAAYESSDESHNYQPEEGKKNWSPEELEAQRHAEGVDAFLKFATEVSTMSSPMKRPQSPDSHVYMENNIPNGNSATITSTTTTAYPIAHHYTVGGGGHQPAMEDGTSNFHNQNGAPSGGYSPQHHINFLSSPSPPKKSRTRTLTRTKLKRKPYPR